MQNVINNLLLVSIMKSKYVRINLTIPEENLNQIDEFCKSENINRSEFLRLRLLIFS